MRQRGRMVVSNRGGRGRALDEVNKNTIGSGGGRLQSCKSESEGISRAVVPPPLVARETIFRSLRVPSSIFLALEGAEGQSLLPGARTRGWGRDEAERQESKQTHRRSPLLASFVFLEGSYNGAAGAERLRRLSDRPVLDDSKKQKARTSSNREAESSKRSPSNTAGRRSSTLAADCNK